MKRWRWWEGQRAYVPPSISAGGKVSLFSQNSVNAYLEPSSCWASRSCCLSPVRSLVLWPEASLGDIMCLFRPPVQSTPEPQMGPDSLLGDWALSQPCSSPSSPGPWCPCRRGHLVGSVQGPPPSEIPNLSAPPPAAFRKRIFPGMRQIFCIFLQDTWCVPRNGLPSVVWILETSARRSGKRFLFSLLPHPSPTKGAQRQLSVSVGRGEEDGGRRKSETVSIIVP